MRTQCRWGKGAEAAEGYVVGEVGREAGVSCCCLFAHFGGWVLERGREVLRISFIWGGVEWGRNGWG